MPPSVEDPDISALSTPALIDDLAETCRSYVFRALGFELDDSPDTLPVLDQYLSSARQSVHERPELTPLVVRAVGAYFGRVLGDAVEGFWVGAGPDVERWRLCSRTVFLSINPAGVVAEALGEGAEDKASGRLRLAPEDESLVAARFDALPPMPEEEYRLLSTRFEAVVLAYETLLAEKNSQDLQDVVFDPEDYAEDGDE